MRLVHLSIASIAGCLLGLVILVGLTLDSVQKVRAKQAEVAELLDLQARMDGFSVASDSLLLFGADAGLVAAYRKEAEALRTRLREVGGDSPGARRAAHRIEQIATAVTREIERRAGAQAGDGPLELPPRSRIVMNQVAGLGGALDSALDTLLRQRQRQIARDATWIGGGLVGAALLFGALSVIAFILIHRRVAAPARELGRTLEAIRGGDLDARAAVRGDDELADLADTLNRMLDERRTMDAALQARNRRLQQYQRLVEHSRDRFCIVDSEYRYLLANEAYAALYGRDRASLEGSRLADILDREFLEREALPPIDRCLAGEPQSFEAERTFAGIGTRRFLIRYYPLPDTDGTIRQVAAVMTDITEQQALHVWMQQYYQLIEASQDLCATCDRDCRYVLANRAYAEAYGMEPGEIVGRHLREVVGEEHYEAVVRPEVEHCLAGEPRRYETERRLDSRGTRRLLVRYDPIRDEHGAVTHVGAVMTDVTDIREAEAELAQQGRQLDMAGRAARFGAWSADLESARIEWSDVVAEIHGMPRGYSPTIDEDIGFYAPEHRERIRELWNACVEQGAPYDEELQIINADGERVWVREVGEPVRDDSGAIVRVQGAFQDISARKAMEQEAQRLHERFAAMLESITDAFVAFDRHWRYSYVNPEAERLLGFPAEDLLGSELWARFPDLAGTESERALREAMEQRETREAEEYFAPLQAWFDIRVYPFETGVAVYFRDVTDQHRMLEQLQQQEAELRQSRDQLDAALGVRQSLINSLPAHIAMLNGEGTIIDINEQWRHFGRDNAYAGDDFGLGVNYIRLCEAASGDCADEAAEVAAGLRAVLAGEQEIFALEYPCHSPDQFRWFRVMINRLIPGGDHGADHGVVVMHVDISERKRAEQELNRLAYEDALTGLYSRNGFMQQLSERIEQRGWQASGTVLVLDIIGQRDINDAHGYEIGDRLLSEVGRRLREQVGEHGFVGRIGGDEFALYLLPRSGETLEQRLTRLAGSLAEPFVLDHLTIEIGNRLGYSHLGNQPRKVEELLREAELALFRHRSESALPWVAYSAELDREANQRIELTRELRRAIDEEQFELHFQPKVDLRDGLLTSCEALLRWHHPERGLVSPALFIPIAEQSQLIGPIGDWVLRRACRHLREWQDAGLDIVRVAVNVSLVQFQFGDFTGKVRDALAEFGLEPSSLSLEITESVFEHESETLLRQVRALHDMGVRLSLDDFGTGYSSLLYLQRYPFDEIKVDQGFVFRLLDDAYSRNIVETVMGLARALDAEVVAEGIESAEVRDVLMGMGCRYGQGFYYSMPLAAEDFRWLLESRSHLPVSATANA
ncbi:MAG: EAL domain-containing protein [Halofilum sp. (in: g-proteobacteria)]|nr:EAL domain-containing protein [Halofilum sp. (in: g-proteobacteria)]